MELIHLCVYLSESKKQIRNPNNEIRNNLKTENSNDQNGKKKLSLIDNLFLGN